MDINVDPHPSLFVSAFTAVFKDPLGSFASPEWLTSLLHLHAQAPTQRSERVRSVIRNLLRHGGYKPTGRGKPASEYLVRSAEQSRLVSINAAVDTCNAVSLHSGLPISVVDLDLAQPPFRVSLAGPKSSYVFNPSGQEIRIEGLLCLQDVQGPCANAVKDAQRTKTSDSTRRTLTLIWGAKELQEHTSRATDWYIELLQRLDARTERHLPAL